MKVEKLVLALAGKMSLEGGVPFGHSVDLIIVVSLTRAVAEISLSPFAVTSGKLFDTENWVFTVVSVNISITSFSVIIFSWSTVWELGFIIVSTSLVSSFEVSFHTGSIFSEFFYPFVL